MEPRLCLVLKKEREQEKAYCIGGGFVDCQTSRKIKRCKLGSSSVPPDYDCCTIEISAGLSLKLLVVKSGLVMLGVWLWGPRVA